MARLKSSHKVDRRTAFIGANVSQSERAEVERRAGQAGRRLSDFIRMTLLSDRPSTVMQPKLSAEAGRKIAVELARIGTNLNQLAYHANSTRALPVRDAIDATLEEIVKATEALIQL